MSIAKAYRQISFRVARWRGIEVYIDLTTLLILWIYNNYSRSDWWPAREKIIEGVLLGVLLIASILVHELAHAWVGLLCGAQVDKIYLNVLGGVCIFRTNLESPWRNLLISLAGPLSNLALWLLFNQAYRQGMDQTDMSVWLPAIKQAASLNLLLAILNLLPAYPLDGGHALRHLTVLLTRRELVGAWLSTITGLGVAGWLGWTIWNGHSSDWYSTGVLFLFAALILLATWAQLHLARQEARKKGLPAVKANESFPLPAATAILARERDRLCAPLPDTGRYDYRAIYKKATGRAAVRQRYEKKTLALPRPFESIVIATRYGPTHLLAFGPAGAPAALMLDGPHSDALNWKRLVPYLQYQYRVYALDLPGQPNLSSPVRLSLADLSYGEWLTDVMDGLGLARAHLVGEMGGSWPVFKLAVMSPERVASATLISPLGLVPQSLHNVKTSSLLWELFSLMVPMRSSTALFYHKTTPRNLRRPAEAEEELIDEIIFKRKYCRTQNFSELLDESELVKLAAPSLVILGQETRLYNPARVVEKTRESLPQLWGALVVPDSMGSVSTDRPEWLGRKLLDFWGELGQPQG